MTEIIAMMARMRDPDRQIQHAGNLQTSVIRKLRSFVNDPGSHPVIGKTDIMRWLLELTAKDKTIYSDFTRIWFAKPVRKRDPRRELPIWRLMLHPIAMAHTGEVVFYGMHIQPDPERLRARDEAHGETASENNLWTREWEPM